MDLQQLSQIVPRVSVRTHTHTHTHTRLIAQRIVLAVLGYGPPSPESNKQQSCGYADTVSIVIKEYPICGLCVPGDVPCP